MVDLHNQRSSCYNIAHCRLIADKSKEGGLEYGNIDYFRHGRNTLHRISSVVLDPLGKEMAQREPYDLIKR